MRSSFAEAGRRPIWLEDTSFHLYHLARSRRRQEVTTVVDASVLVAALVDSGFEGVWAESIIADGPLVGPEMVLAEACNILRRMELANEISSVEASLAYDGLLRIDLELFPFAPFAERVWALRNNVVSYDAWYVAMAELLDCPLATLDRRLSRATGPTCGILTPSNS